MPTRSWTGDYDSNYDNDQNWIPFFVPVSGDDVTVPRPSTGPGGISISDGLDQEGVSLRSMYIEDGYTGTIGSSTEGLKIGATQIVHRGWSTLNLNADFSVSELIIDAPNMRNACTLTEDDDGAYNRITVVRGKLIAGDITGTNVTLQVSYKSNVLGDVFVDWTDATSAPLEIYQNGGTVFISTFGSIVAHRYYISNGRILINQASNQEIIELVMAGGIADVQGTEVGDIIGTGYIGGGILTLLEDNRPKTIDKLLVMPGGLALYGDNVTITNGGSMTTAPIIG